MIKNKNITIGYIHEIRRNPKYHDEIVLLLEDQKTDCHVYGLVGNEIHKFVYMGLYDDKHYFARVYQGKISVI